MKIKSFVGFIVVATIASMANAASVDWTTGALSFGETSLKKSTDVAGYLVYLSSGSLASTYTIDDSFSAASVGTASDTDGANKGALLTGSLSVTTLGYGNGDVFAFVASYKADGKTYWNISETLNTLSGVDPNDPTVSPADFTAYSMSSTVAGETGKATAGGGWTAAAVPEPSTAVLALAGLALLLKRRKA